MIVVSGFGRVPCDWMVVGEAPGRQEAFAQPYPRPFAGPSGRELAWYLQRHGLNLNDFYLDNVCRLYRDGNPDPTPELIEEWTPRLLATIAEVRPRVIIPVGRYAVRWFLGDAAEMDACHGIPHQGGEFDSTRKDRAMGAVVVPSFHPAYGLHQIESRAWIDSDIRHAADVIRLVQGGRRDLVKFRHDAYEGRERYDDVTGAELRALLHRARPSRVGFDTEGTPEVPWSLQVSWEPGTGHVLRCSRPDFAVGVEALQELADSGCMFSVHDAGTPRGTGYDTQVSRTCGLELRDANLSNTMYRAFALRLEPKGLKPLLWRWCGMRQDDYWGMVEEIGRRKQVEYLRRVAARKDWPRVPSRVEIGNDGVLAVKKFGKLESRAKGIVTDVDKDKRNKDGEPVNPQKRWGQLEPELRALAESEMGQLPIGTLDDVDLDTAVFYAGRDADGTLRLDLELEAECRRMGVEGVCWTGDRVLPIFEEMQREGIPASRRAFVDLASTVSREMQQIQAGLSTNWFGGKPFNPAPNTKDVAALVAALGITGLKKTKKTKKPSTSMKSLEYMAPKYPALAQIGEWRRRQKVLSTYCLPLIEIADRDIKIEARRLGDDNDGELWEVGPGLDLPDSGWLSGSDLFLVRCKFKPVSVETRRLAAEDPSLLNQPVRTALGRKVRACYMTALRDDPNDPDQEVFAEWDFNSQEVRVAAHITGDRLLCAIMRDPKRKIHMETASRVFGKPIDQIDEVGEKIPAKTAFFGMIYGLSGLGLMDLFRSFGLENWPLDACESLIREIFRIYPGLEASTKAAAAEAQRVGYVRDLYGHIRYLPGIWSSNRAEASEASRQAFSHWIQSTAQGLTQNAMVWLRKPIRDLQRAGLPVRWCLQIHDSLMLRMPRWMFPVVDGIMTEGMTQHYGGPGNVKLSVPVLVDAHMSTRWSELK